MRKALSRYANFLQLPLPPILLPLPLQIPLPSEQGESQETFIVSSMLKQKCQHVYWLRAKKGT